MNPYRLDQLGDNDYDNGQWHPIIPGSIMDVALRNEPWINHSNRSRRNWINLMDNPEAVFSGTILSIPRQQIALMVVLGIDEPVRRRWMTETVVTLHHFERFI